VCDKSPEHSKIRQAVEKAQLPADQQKTEHPLVFRDAKSSRDLEKDGVVF